MKNQRFNLILYFNAASAVKKSANRKNLVILQVVGIFKNPVFHIKPEKL
ncbi:MAG: hypothetical protein BWZ11_01359 [Bacteroidetes bacterium ADurb.BinA395]|nr:MAG: hypothetical protein BWZ11_01359 [Bacteroidetes bacterium ADurb.BinA395]